ncbi:hypothetical protein [Kitasatospora sp. NPDC047058]|uniref:hypothetical protein n=1 Tax=Kitasatospora sp. NPDC047058 TaxID=3155620 RepID=UPI003403F20C
MDIIAEVVGGELAVRREWGAVALMAVGALLLGGCGGDGGGGDGKLSKEQAAQVRAECAGRIEPGTFGRWLADPVEGFEAHGNWHDDRTGQCWITLPGKGTISGSWEPFAVQVAKDAEQAAAVGRTCAQRKADGEGYEEVAEIEGLPDSCVAVVKRNRGTAEDYEGMLAVGGHFITVQLRNASLRGMGLNDRNRAVMAQSLKDLGAYYRT